MGKMRRMWLGETVLDHQSAFRSGLLLLIVLLLLSNGWFAYSRALSLANQYAHRAVSSLEQHFDGIDGFIDIIHADAVSELKQSDGGQDQQAVLSWLRNAPGQGFYTLDARPTLASGLQPGNLTGLGQAAALDAAARHEMAVVLGLTPMMQMAYQHLGEHGVDWVYYVSARQFIYLYPFTPATSYHYSANTPQGQFWRLAEPAVNPRGQRVITPVYIDQAGKGPMLTISQPLWVAGQFRGVLCMDVGLNTLNQLLRKLDAPAGSLYLLNRQNQVVATSDDHPLPQENLQLLPVMPTYAASPTAHVRVYALGDSGMRVLQYLPNYWLALEVARGCAPGVVAAVLLWLALLLLTRTWQFNRELRRLSEHDALTGALNHRAFQSLLAQLYQDYQTQGTVFALVMVDLDHFKKVNDSHGHAVGDTVLKVLVRLALRLLRNEDRVARLGGEEFVLVLPATDLPDAMKAAVRLRLQLERLHWGKLGLPEPVTASMGCAVVLPDDRHASDVLKRADDAMYRAKQEGRNRVCLHWQGPAASGN